MKIQNEMFRDSGCFPYQNPSVSVYAIAYPMSILKGSDDDPEPTDTGEIIPAF